MCTITSTQFTFMTIKIEEDEVLLYYTCQEGNVGLNMSLQNSVMNFGR